MKSALAKIGKHRLASKSAVDGYVLMGVGFHLAASYPVLDATQTPEDWLEQVAAWLQGHEEEPLMLCRPARCDHGEAALFVEVHPGAEEVEFCVPEPGHFVACAKTSSAGPGYHVFLCDLLHRLGQRFNLSWHAPDAEEGTGDETGYFFDGDRDTPRQEMLRWLAALAHVVTDEEFAEESQIRMVSMPLGYSYPEQEGILTPLGPRSPDWFRQVAEAPARGIDFFPWWPEGVGSAFFLGRALCRMWQEVRWRPPQTDAEGELLMDVHLDLERAYRLDAAAPIPWREWSELLEYLTEHFGYVEFPQGTNLENEVRARAQRSLGGTRIGYRRGPVHVSLTGGWSIVVPGELAEEWQEDGETWTAWVGARRVSFMSWSVREADEPQPARAILRDLELPSGEHFEHRDGSIIGRAVFRAADEPDQSGWNLKAYSAVDGGFALCDLWVNGRDDLPWALDVWKSLRHS
jgi:hypothetical protein